MEVGGQVQYLMKEIDRQSENIWLNKGADWQGLGQLVQQINPVLGEILLKIENKQLIEIDVSGLMGKMMNLMQALERRDEMRIADVLYYEIKEVLMMDSSKIGEL